MLPVPLTSPLMNSVAGDGGLQSPRACRIVHGPNDSCFENIAGKTVASIRRSLATVFSLPDDAKAFIGGSVVDGQYRLRAGDSLEFLRTGWGRKASVPESLLPPPEHWEAGKPAGTASKLDRQWAAVGLAA